MRERTPSLSLSAFLVLFSSISSVFLQNEAKSCTPERKSTPFYLSLPAMNILLTSLIARDIVNFTSLKEITSHRDHGIFLF